MPTLIVVVVFIATWIALYSLVIRPRLLAFRYTAGIHAKLEAIEAGWWPKLGLLLKGAKVAIIGFVTSMAPVMAVFYDRIAGLDWTQILPGEKARLVAALVAILGIIGPMIMVWLHQGAIAEAAALEPRK